MKKLIRLQTSITDLRFSCPNRARLPSKLQGMLLPKSGVFYLQNKLFTK